MILNYWKRLHFTTKFSIIAFIVTLALGLLSMGALGAVLYYTVSFLFTDIPSFNDWRGDWVWPTLITVGMAWAFGFVIAGFTWHYLKKIIASKTILRIIYIVILWLWAAMLWYLAIPVNI